jgi:UDP-N-acetylmuramoylalanine--D-glutamate ligase
MLRQEFIDKIKSVAIVGAGESGVGAAILAVSKVMTVFLSDYRTIADKYKQELIDLNIPFEESGHTFEKILSADIIIKSPGVPHKSKIIQEAYKNDIPVISEIEFASYYTEAQLIGITGTNGKSTTTSMTYHILKEAGLNVAICGNIGKSFARLVAKNEHTHYVIELSSFQLDDIKYYRNCVGILLNITPDHLDRYDYQFENYIKSKFQITKNQTQDDYLIYNTDDAVIEEYLHKIGSKAKLIPFSLSKEVFPGAYVTEEDNLHIGINTKNDIIMQFSKDTNLIGKHNQENTMASALAAKIMKIHGEAIKEHSKSFTGLTHRMEYVATVEQVDYINDSKATNVNSVWYALDCMKKQVILIMGGVDKGNDYNQLKPLVKEKVRMIICLGEDNSLIIEALENEVGSIHETKEMTEAVRIAYERAIPGDVVMLSPACASFDLFNNFEDRGEQFKDAVFQLLTFSKQKLEIKRR